MPWILLIALFIALPCPAHDLGTYGRVYPLVEEDLVEVMMARAQAEVDSGQWERTIEAWREKARARAARPKGIILPRAQQERSFHYDPSIVVSHDIKDASGALLYPKGTQVNPLDFVSMTQGLILIDGDDPEQLDWMLGLDDLAAFKVVLTNGPILDLMKRLNHRLYFDQHQRLVNKFGVKALPVRIYQDGPRYLRVDEVVI
jgi:conjugal transfer pilus assembly protein TraW